MSSAWLSVGREGVKVLENMCAYVLCDRLCKVQIKDISPNKSSLKLVKKTIRYCIVQYSSVPAYQI